ncbi:MAG: hypothetical protein OXC44_00250 [Proteobacteria bacterium]|nr:hypothetical protein [Pseudomonadota bacterium]
MKYRSYLSHLACILCLSVITMSCSRIGLVEKDKEKSQLQSVNDGSTHFVTVDAKDDSTSVTFYTCYGDDLKDEVLKNPRQHLDVCVNAFLTTDGEALTISKKSFKTKEVREFLTQNWEKIENLTQVNSKDMNLDLSNGGPATLFGALAAFGGLAAMFMSIKFPKSRILDRSHGLLVLAGMALLGYGMGDFSRTKDAIERHKNQKATVMFDDVFSIDENIDFKKLAKENAQTDSEEYKNLESIMDSLGSLENEYQNTIIMNDAFYKYFVRFLQKLNLPNAHKVVLYCQMLPEKNCKPV